MKRSQLTPMPEYFDRYINLCDDVDLSAALQISIDELSTAFMEKCESLGDKIYAPGKWTVKDILQHMIDTERIFCYRALAFARGEAVRLPSFEEDDYAKNADAGRRTVKELFEELKLVHESTKVLYKSFTPAMLEKKGWGFKGMYSVASIGFCIPGHQRWHIKVIEERYFPLLNMK
ncbi:MAG TPA: DinB family protein [Bacteroidia bacterium]|nr:DinB family protein [Bacteroidia bacterium]HNU33232.1 DinB family protein [Bacteroidia bacterium]